VDLFKQPAQNISYETTQAMHHSLRDESLLNILRLIRSENVGPVTFFQLINRYKSVEKAISALPMLAFRGGLKRNIKLCSVQQASDEMEATLKIGAKLIAYGTEHYPELLMQIPDAPPLLIAHGHTHLLKSKPILGMVGSRNASGNACRFAENMAGELGKASYIVASGMARGIDTYAHKGSLKSGSIGVIAGGIDQVYPNENAALFKQMIETNVIITESPFSTPPQHRHFPARNRIIAGISKGIIVVEAAQKSGSLITAKCALEYNREIFAVPGFPLDPRASGTNQLIKEGAMLVSSAHDVIDSLLNRPHYLSDYHAKSAFNNFNVANDDNAPDDDATLDSEREMILSLLSHTPLMVEEILSMTGIPPQIVNVILLELEIAGLINYHIGGAISRKYDE
jgi:DNA processing protein